MNAAVLTPPLTRSDLSRLITMGKATFYHLVLINAQQATLNKPLTSYDLTALLFATEIEKGIEVNNAVFDSVHARVCTKLETAIENNLIRCSEPKYFNHVAESMGFVNRRPTQAYVWTGGNIRPYINAFQRTLAVSVPVESTVLAVTMGEWDNRFYIVEPHKHISNQYVEVKETTDLTRALKELSVELCIPYDVESLAYLTGKMQTRYAVQQQPSEINKVAWELRVKTVDD